MLLYKLCCCLGNSEKEEDATYCNSGVISSSGDVPVLQHGVNKILRTNSIKVTSKEEKINSSVKSLPADNPVFLEPADIQNILYETPKFNINRKALNPEATPKTQPCKKKQRKLSNSKKLKKSST